VLFKNGRTTLKAGLKNLHSMASIIPGYEYDIFISYRQKDNKYDGWVTEFVNNLRKELEATFKEDLSIYTDDNPKDGLLETHNVDKSLEGKLKSLIFIPIISRTYCDTKSFAWSHEFCAFNKMAKEDQFGRDIKFSNGNVASRILPIKIHDLDPEDKRLIETELGGVLRAVDFIYKEAGVNRPLKPSDNKYENLNKTDYRNQVNKVANAIKEIIGSLKGNALLDSSHVGDHILLAKSMSPGLKLTRLRSKILFAVLLLIILTTIALSLNKFQLTGKTNETTLNSKITKSPIAYDLYSKARFRLTPENKEDVDSCILFLTKAIEADSLFALAHAELAWAYSLKNFFFAPGKGYTEKAYIEAQKSLYLEPNLPEGLFAEAFNTWNLQNKFPHEKVIREYKRIIGLKPELDKAYDQLAIVYAHVGLMDEALKTEKKALKINPENKLAIIDLNMIYSWTVKKTDLELALDLNKQTPDHIISTFSFGFWAIALITLDRTSEAEYILSERMKEDSLDLNVNSAYAVLLAKKGDKTGALKKIESYEKGDFKASTSHHAIYNLAVAYALLGDYQKSVDKLTWVAENGFPNYTFFRDDPLLSSLHQFPPYIELMKKLKISYEKYKHIAKE
jgi:tetratricopeptide (TPR) repeat protein